MATRRKTLTVPDAIPEALRDPWKNTGAAKLLNGVQVTRWENSETGETAWIQLGMHPEDEQVAAQNPAYINEIPDEPDDMEETPTDRVMALLTNAKGEGRAELNVYRIVNGERQYCTKYKPEEFEEGTFEMLRSSFGAGDYELRLYATDPRTGRFNIRSLARVKIAESKMPSQGDALPSGLSQVLTTIAQGQEQMLRALVDMKQAPQKDPMEEMTKMLSMMTMMREAMGMNVPQSREKSSIGEIVSAIKELKGAAAEFSPQEEKEPDSLMGMLPKVLELVSASQQAQTVQPQQAIQTGVLSQVTIPGTVAAAHNPAKEPQPEENVNIMTMIKLKGYLKTLNDMAQAARPVEEGAQFVYDKLPDDLIEIMALDNWFELLSGVAGEVKPHEKWLKAVRDKAMTMFEPETPEN